MGHSSAEVHLTPGASGSPPLPLPLPLAQPLRLLLGAPSEPTVPGAALVSAGGDQAGAHGEQTHRGAHNWGVQGGITVAHSSRVAPESQLLPKSQVAPASQLALKSQVAQDPQPPQERQATQEGRAARVLQAGAWCAAPPPPRAPPAWWCPWTPPSSPCTSSSPNSLAHLGHLCRGLRLPRWPSTPAAMPAARSRHLPGPGEPPTLLFQFCILMLRQRGSGESPSSWPRVSHAPLLLQSCILGMCERGGRRGEWGRVWEWQSLWPRVSHASVLLNPAGVRGGRGRGGEGGRMRERKKGAGASS